MPSKDKEIIIRVRGIILNEEKMLVVNMPDNNFYCLPGGKLEWGEDLKECLNRELIEELGVKPDIGKLIYINTFMEKNINQSIDFIFEILNGKDYLNCEELERTHSYELSDLCWVDKNENLNILPKTLNRYFKKGNIIPNEVIYINE